MRSTQSPVDHDSDPAGSGWRVEALRGHARRPGRGLPLVVLLVCAVFASITVLALNT